MGTAGLSGNHCCNCVYWTGKRDIKAGKCVTFYDDSNSKCTSDTALRKNMHCSGIYGSSCTSFKKHPSIDK